MEIQLGKMRIQLQGSASHSRSKSLAPAKSKRLLKKAYYSSRAFSAPPITLNIPVRYYKSPNFTRASHQSIIYSIHPWTDNLIYLNNPHSRILLHLVCIRIRTRNCSRDPFLIVNIAQRPYRLILTLLILGSCIPTLVLLHLAFLEMISRCGKGVEDIAVGNLGAEL
ncbi:hypothetical protein L207DRAFT_318461 [Hyaloscypha variabilis F]|uniref:Uncharacterized protein n=1 Tax=Hyaloscypha variabilis (strain UAMH 11265 / GT02V1 / F) TaxID=1149755 RepID=A0A2J6RVZ2_HYAVF|nr:hypothetical protein L207DRAFT_318461 [Hyaloscypha variabilis F]